VLVDDGGANLERCLFFANYATVPSLAHAAAPYGLRVMLTNASFDDNEVPDDVQQDDSRASQIDSTALVFASPELQVLAIDTEKVKPSWQPSAREARTFLSDQDAWLDDNVAAVSVEQPPFWKDINADDGSAPQVDQSTVRAAKAEPWYAGIKGVKRPNPMTVATGVLIALVAIISALCCWIVVLRRRRVRGRQRLDGVLTGHAYASHARSRGPPVQYKVRSLL
jgi:hypothetical protein